MLRIPTLRILAALTIALTTLAVVAAPAMAETTLNMCTGNCGYYEYKDGGPSGPKGAVCKYETASYDLDFISVRPPLMHGPYAYKTKVGWQYKIYRSKNFGSTWSVYKASTWQTAKANDAIPVYAGHGLSRRYWYAPDPNPTGWFKVRVYLRWWSGSGSVIGNASAEYDWYQRLWTNQVDVAQQYCIQDW